MTLPCRTVPCLFLKFTVLQLGLGHCQSSRENPNQSTRCSQMLSCALMCYVGSKEWKNNWWQSLSGFHRTSAIDVHVCIHFVLILYSFYSRKAAFVLAHSTCFAVVHWVHWPGGKIRSMKIGHFSSRKNHIRVQTRTYAIEMHVGNDLMILNVNIWCKMVHERCNGDRPGSAGICEDPGVSLGS